MAPRFEQQAPQGPAPVIEGYAAGGFRVSGRAYAGGVIVTPTRVIEWPVAGLAALTPAAFDALGDEPIEVVLLGTGATLRRPPPDVMAALRDRGLALEPMDSKAAARTYGVLANEGRQVAAALLPL
jgi:uncharacterized protein